ncbi:MAG: thymidine phosphorylase [Mycobacteriaceae bacterium]|nr:thymidine phosphorylase [Mycobacteriaceae bacterium]
MAGLTFDAPTVIRAKRDGGRLSPEAIDWVIRAYTDGEVADEQMSALLMAIFLRGMDRDEIARWTTAMVHSGQRFDFTDLRRDGKPLKLVDKHSTGGVGDKITIPLVPIVVACGGTVPQAAGRGLGHTGGTLDKLEAIPGFTAELSKSQIRQQLCDVGAAIFAAGELTPADRKIYALRDVTGTTESLALIASSVMSKKIAEGTRALVLDCKVGSGAFLATEEQSRELARTMVELGTHEGLATSALLTDMNRPLGLTVGNALEVAESLEVLAGGGPDDVVTLTLALAAEMLQLAGLDARDPADTLRDGSAMDCFRALVTAQHGDTAQQARRAGTAQQAQQARPARTAQPADLSARLPLGPHTETVTAPTGGTMGDIDAMAVAMAAWRLGAGRTRPGEPVQHGAGVRIHCRPGDPVAAGEPVFTLYTATPDRFPAAIAELDRAWTRGEPADRPLIIDRIGP